MVVDDTLLRGTTILAMLARRGVRVAAVTAKDKLRLILAHELNDSICFSAEKAGDVNLKEHGIDNVEKWVSRPAPPQYSRDLSIFVLDSGVKLLEDKADVLYLTLSDLSNTHTGQGAKNPTSSYGTWMHVLADWSILGLLLLLPGITG